MSDQSAPSKAKHPVERRDVFWQRLGPDKNVSADPRFAACLVPAQQRWSLRLISDGGTAPATVAQFDLTQPINELRETKASDGTDLISCRLGPDEWLLIANTSTTGTIAADIARDLSSSQHTVVDISHRNVAFEISGTHVSDVLNTGCPLDLGDAAFPIGMATRTLFSKAEIVLLRLASPQGAAIYRIECWRSYARYLHAHLIDSARLLDLTP